MDCISIAPSRVTDDYRAFPNVEGRNSRQAQIEVPLFASLLKLPRNANVLEIGCGRGIALPVIARLRSPRHLVGIDIDRCVLPKRARSAEWSFARADARQLPFPTSFFDVVIDFGTCYHISRSDDALKEIARVLKPDGMFCTETKLSQFLSHPVRSFGRRLAWKRTRVFRLQRHALLWMSLKRVA
jgi:ubiquinone/menaquinone biosynthesis C-methylase UbiE